MVGDYSNIMKTTLDFNFDLYQGFKQHTVVGDYINIMKTTLDFNFDLNSMDIQNMEKEKNCQFEKLTLIVSRIVI